MGILSSLGTISNVWLVATTSRRLSDFQGAPGRHNFIHIIYVFSISQTNEDACLFLN